MHYFVKIPGWLRRLYPQRIWRTASTTGISITFDDGPHPVHTPAVLSLLKAYQAKATFFCVGKNVAAYPEIFRQICDEGHAVGNHTETHVRDGSIETGGYMYEVKAAAEKIPSKLFRPPYGRLKRFTEKLLREEAGFTIVMWSVLSGDFDEKISAEKCAKNVLEKTKPGDIVVFHDSEKAAPRTIPALEKLLLYCREKNWQLETLENGIT